MSQEQPPPPAQKSTSTLSSSSSSTTPPSDDPSSSQKIKRFRTRSPEEEEQDIRDSKNFKIRTLNNRHLDFDNEFDLEDINSPERSKFLEPFYFIQGADSQFGMIDSYIYNLTEPGWSEEIKLCEQLIDYCRLVEPKPKFLIICGDLIDSLPASEIGQKQLIDFKRIFSKLEQLNVPLVCVCGNHDIGDKPTNENLLEYKRQFGDDYFYFTLNDCLFIIINSQFYKHREFLENYASEQDKWLELILEKCKLFKYSFVFQHIPWFLDKQDENDDYFNIDLKIRLNWLKKFREAGVTKIFCGHYHRNAGGWYDETMELIVTTAIGAQIGQDVSGVRIVKVLQNSIKHDYYAMDDIPLKIEL